MKKIIVCFSALGLLLFLSSCSLIAKNNNQALENNWKTYIYNEFNFNFPSNWTISTTGLAGNDKVEFLNEAGQKIALLTCPLTETGYENFTKIKDLKRSYLKNNINFNVEIYTFKGIVEKNGFKFPDVNLLLMSQNGSNSCQLISSSDWGDQVAKNIDLEAVYDKIYQSVN